MEPEQEKASTLAGLILKKIKRMPRVGERIEFNQFIAIFDKIKKQPRIMSMLNKLRQYTTHQGVFYALLAALLFGASTPFAKYFLVSVNPWLLAGLFYLGSGLIILVILLGRFFFKSFLFETKLHLNEWFWLLLTTLLGGILAPVLWMFGLQIMLGATASLLLSFETLFTALIAWLFFKEHTTHRLVWGMILILFGGILLSGSIDFHSKQLLGYALITGACLMWALDNNFTRHIATADPLLIVGVKSLLAGIFNVMVILLWGIKFIFSLKIVLSSLLIGAVSYGLSLVCFILALRYIGTGRTSAYFSSAPFIGSLFSIIFLKEPFSFTWLFSGILMGCGIWLHMTERHEHEHSHEALVHEHSHTHDEHHQHEHSCSDPSGEPHSHLHEHKPLRHRHTHSPDIHHRHGH